MHKFIEQVKNYFSISEKEARGFIILTIIMLLVIFVPFALKFIPSQQIQVEPPIVINLSEGSDTISQYKFFPFDPNLISTLEWRKMGLNHTLSQRIENYKTAGGRFKIKSDLRKIYGFPEETYLALHQFILLPDSVVKISDTISQHKFFPFDPNLISTLEWRKMGLNHTLSQRIENYKAAGGRFKIKRDLKKIYGFPEETYLALHQFILLPDSLVKTKVVSQEQKRSVALQEKPFELININTANETQLEAIYGIGPVLSKRILKYRTLLGGFVYKEQFKEVYGLDSLVIEQVVKQTFIAPNFQPLQIEIPNSGLPYHPYLNKDQAKALVILFKNKKILSKKEILNSEKFSQEDLVRLSPYLPLK